MSRPITLKEFAKYLDDCSLDELKSIALKVDPKIFPKRFQLLNDKISALQSKVQNTKKRIPSKKEKANRIRVQYIIGGLLAVFVGVSKAHFNTPNIGWFALIGGIFIIVYYAFQKIDIDKIQKAKPKFSICQNCGEIYTDGLNAPKCNACDINLEPLEGFLDRHPDFLIHLRGKDT